MIFLNLSYLVFSNKEEYSTLISDKLTELGTTDNFFSDDVEDYLRVISEKNDARLLILVSGIEDNILSLLTSIHEINNSAKITLLSTQHTFDLNQYELIGFTEFMRMKKESPLVEYIPISISDNKSLKVLPCDLFVKVGGNKYLKLINKNEDLSSVELEKYQDKSEDYLFVTKEDAPSFYKAIFKDNLRESSSKMAMEEFLLISLMIEAAVPLSIALKLPPSLVEGVVNAHIDVYKEVKSFTDLKSFYRDDKDGVHRLTHTMLSSLISSKIINGISWANSTTYKKIVKCLILHDISLKGEAFDYSQMKSVKDTTLLPKLYFLHPLRSAALVEMMDFVDNDIVTMITQHHEQGDGSGFPKGLTNTKISKISCIFIIAEYITNELMLQKNWDVLDLARVIKSIPLWNKLGKFEEVASALESEFIESSTSV